MLQLDSCIDCSSRSHLMLSAQSILVLCSLANDELCETESPLRVTFGWLCTCQSYDMGFDFSSHFCLYGRCDAFLAVQSGNIKKESDLNLLIASENVFAGRNGTDSR